MINSVFRLSLIITFLAILSMSSMAQNQSFKSITPKPHIYVSNGPGIELDDFLAPYKLLPDDIGGITISNQGSDGVGQLVVGLNGQNRSIGLGAMAQDGKIANVGIVTLASGTGASNIGLKTSAESGTYNIGFLSEVNGMGDQMKIGGVINVNHGLTNKSMNYGLKTFVVGNGDNSNTHFNVGVESIVSGLNNMNAAFVAKVNKLKTEEGLEVDVDGSFNYGLQSIVEATNSTNYGSYNSVSGESSNNIALFAKSVGGKRNIAAELVGDVLVGSEENNYTVYFNAKQGSILAQTSYLLIPGEAFHEKEMSNELSDKLANVKQTSYTSKTDSTVVKYGFDATSLG